MGLRVYNTLTQKKEDFVSLEPKHVRIYLCGPTVYGLVHVGNMRGPVVFNFIRNYFESIGNKVTFVYNYTDVDDKIIKSANENKVSAAEWADRFVNEFEKDFARLGLRPATVNPRVTTHMNEIIELVSNIIKSGSGYVVDGEVFCSVEKIKEYGKLSHKNIDELVSGARVEIGEKKKNPLDFSLWKPAKPGEPFWESPWGKGRPGWHIECSAMAKKHLGDTFDIHGGGIDLIFPHHENEIAQSESGNGKPFVRYWMHNNFINMGSQKMSKSLGNIFTARNFLDRYNGEILKFMFFSSHYRSPADFSENVINHTLSGLSRIYSGLAQAERWLKRCDDAGFKATFGGQHAGSNPSLGGDEAFDNKVQIACEDDFNTPEIVAELFNQVRLFNSLLRPRTKPTAELANASVALLTRVRKVGKLMALFQESPQQYLLTLDDMQLRTKNLERHVIQARVDERFAARKNKDFKKSDEIRDELVKLGIELRDSAEGTEWEVKK